MNQDAPNPYASPQEDPDDLGNESEFLERIAFRGIVSKLTLRSSLRTGFSWAGFAVLGVGALVCLMNAPPSFLKPFERPSLLYVDTLSEQLGLVGLGLLTLEFWYLSSVVSGKNIEQREAYLLKQSPHLYSQEKQGWLDDQCFYIREGGVDSWVSWHGVGHFQQGQEILLVDWGPGIGGTSVLSADMFDSTIAYQEAGRQLARKTPRGFYLQRLGELPAHFQCDDFLRLKPNDASIIASSQHTTTHSEAWRRLADQIPREIFQNSKPVHRFFGFMVILALVFVQRWWISIFLLSALWLTIFGLGMAIAYYQMSRLLKRSDERLITTRTSFTDQFVYVQSTVACSRIPIDGFSLVNRTERRLVLQHKDAATKSELLRQDFDSEADWTAVCEIFR